MRSIFIIFAIVVAFCHAAPYFGDDDLKQGTDGNCLKIYFNNNTYKISLAPIGDDGKFLGKADFKMMKEKIKLYKFFRSFNIFLS